MVMTVREAAEKLEKLEQKLNAYNHAMGVMYLSLIHI